MTLRRLPGLWGEQHGCRPVLCETFVDAATDIAARHHRTWMKRRRTLNSLIVMLFVFRLVLSGGRKGYATVTAELWDQCREILAHDTHDPNWNGHRTFAPG